uniref:Uncharacterized protein n=1 Tax=Manihot esculenta TaxID=3983 RepID=A0A2C9W0S2_MANES
MLQSIDLSCNKATNRKRLSFRQVRIKMSGLLRHGMQRNSLIQRPSERYNKLSN